MKPNTRLSVGLIFGLLAIMVALLLQSGWITGNTVNRTPTITPRPSFLNTFVGDIAQVQVVDATTGLRFVARRGDDGKWQIAEAPTSTNEQYGVDETRIENAVSILAAVTANRSISQIEALAQYGLDKPLYEITITDKGQDTTISVGAKNPDQTSYFTRKTGSSEIYLISTYNLDSLIEFLTDPPYLRPTPGTPGTGEATAEPTGTPEDGTSGPTSTATEQEVIINVTVQFTPRATSTPTPTITPTPTKTHTPTPTGSATATPKK
jgi:hypothetical protein